jgi:ribonuclease HI
MEILIYIDGASRGNPGMSACACVIKDKKGGIIYKKGKFLGKTTNNYAEFSALKLALQKAKKLKPSSVKIYSDSSLLVNQFNGIYKIKNPKLFNLMAEIRMLALKFKSVTIEHISRDLNIEADRLANITLNKEGFKQVKTTDNGLF